MKPAKKMKVLLVAAIWALCNSVPLYATSCYTCIENYANCGANADVNYSYAMANCASISDPQQRAECEEDAEAVRSAAWTMCVANFGICYMDCDSDCA